MEKSDTTPSASILMWYWYGDGFSIYVLDEIGEKVRNDIHERNGHLHHMEGASR